VRPLALAPDGQGGADVGPAVTLFVERAQAVAPDFRLTDANAAIVLQICRHLDGLPLAIELAAARLRILQPAALLARLDQRLSFLTGGTRDQPHRLRTMGDAIAWSYDLLSPAEQRLFQRLAVFVSGFTLEAAEWVAGIGSPVSGTGGETASSVFDCIASLLDHSLITREIGFDGASRFGMLETIREYGLERLGASGEEAAVRDAHARYCLAYAERYAPEFFRDDDVVLRFDAIAAEHADILAALAHLAATELDDEQVRLAALLGPFWFLGSFHSVGRVSLERALAHPAALPAVEALALANLARLETFQGDHLAAAATLERAVERATASGDQVALALARTGQAILAVFQGDYAAAQERAAEAEALARSGHDPLAAAFARFVQARAIHYGGDLERAEALYRELLVDPPPRYAETTYRYSLAMIARTRGAHQEALMLYAASLPLFLDLGEQWSVATCLEGVAEALAGLGRTTAAARVFGAAASLRLTLAVPMLPADLADYERTVAAVRADLGVDAFAAAWDAGGALSAAAAVAEATMEAAAALGAVEVIDQPARASDSLSALTTREREVLRLLVLGWSDKEIAASLSIGRRTVSNHVATIRDKLAAPSRAAAAALAVRDHLV
jgi:predicted ATPase/DNA-binding CsgD family transcriptional regulator